MGSIGVSKISTLRTIDLELIDELMSFPRGRGFVVGLSDVRFAEFFKDQINIDIDDPKWAVEGSSKGKRLRYFLRKAKDKYAAQILEELWELREHEIAVSGKSDPYPQAEEGFKKLLKRLKGTAEAANPTPQDARKTKWTSTQAAEFNSELLQLATLDPHPRGFAFEKFLQKLFEACGLAPRGAFRITGQQIDGSFSLSGSTYLLEAKWENAQQGNTPLYAFEGKVASKAAWSRGLFISYSGFTEDGLKAFGNQKRTILMDGRDLSETLTSGRSPADVIDAKARRAVETGSPFVRIEDLF